MFWDLVRQAEARFEDYEHQRHSRPDRQRAVGGGRDFDLPLVIRITLILTYLRVHVPQRLVALLFGATQSDVSRDLRRLLPLIEELLPSPDVWRVVADEEPLGEDELLELTRLPDGRVLVDATEQVVYRSQDSETRKQHYSGKRKAFTLKTQFVVNAEHEVLAITVSVPGATHDKKLSDQVHTIDRMPDGSEVRADKGYQGLDKQVPRITVQSEESGETMLVPRLIVYTPFKKPKGGELTEKQKAFNRWLGSLRVRAEHCIGWVKNWAIIATRFRCAHTIYPRVMRVVCGLVNLQTERWQAAKAQSAA